MAEFTHKVDFTVLTPHDKLQILKEMGFQEDPPAECGPDCMSRQGTGLICDCWPPTTSWKAPADVREFMGETHKARREFAERRQTYENDGVGDSPGLWITHLEKTAPRYTT